MNQNVIDVIEALKSVISCDTVTVRWNYHIYTIKITDGIDIIKVVEGDSLLGEEEDPEAPRPSDYEPSVLTGDTTQEQLIIDKYNELLKRKYDEKLEQSWKEYQMHTAMITWEEGDDGDVASYLSKKFKKMVIELLGDEYLYIAWDK